MKKLMFTVFLISLFVFITKGQIELEHTFKIINCQQRLHIFYQDHKPNFYYIQNDTLMVFNPDYSVYKFIYLKPPAGYRVAAIQSISFTLFDTDDKLEFLCLYENISNNHYLSELLNEDMILIKDFGDQLLYEILEFSDNVYKLVVDKGSGNDCNYEVYSLPGSYQTGINSIGINNSKSLAYPNPSITIINLPYKLEKGRTATFRIFNNNGQLIEQKQIDSEFDCILLNVESYKPGVYFYEYNGYSNKFVVQ